MAKLGRSSIVPAVIAAAITAAVLVPVLSKSTGMSMAASKPVHLSIFDPDGDYQNFVLTGAKGAPISGTSILEHHDVADFTNGAALGQNITHGTVVRTLTADDFVLIIDCTTVLKDGEITFYGGGKFSDLTTPHGLIMAITGGTGAYSKVHGTVTAFMDKKDGKSGTRLEYSVAKV